VQISGREDTSALMANLEQHGFPCLDLSTNELAKLHLCHMVGGRLPPSQEGEQAAGRELLYRFEFPERPGALMAFVSALHPNWNISIFHYRNHGADVGRIVVGVQVPDAEIEDWRRFLADLPYQHWEETGNPAYQLFLGEASPARPALAALASS
jgi:threonine dehydratase